MSENTFIVHRFGKELAFPVALRDRIHAWLEGYDTQLVQVSFPELDADHREFLLTGILPSEFPK